MNQTIQSRVLAEWKEDSNINPSKLDESLGKAPTLHAKYLEYYAENNKLLYKNTSRLEKARKLKRLYYEGKLSKERLDELEWPYDPYEGGKKPIKSEVPMWIENDDDVLAIKEKIDEHKTVKELLREILQQIQWRTQTIKTMLESRKFDAGF